MKIIKFTLVLVLFSFSTMVGFCQKKPHATADFADSISVAANTGLHASAFKKIFLGKNYRKEWLQPVKVPVLHLQTACGGLTPTKEGGGKQTHTLKVKDATGREWSLRSIKKFPGGAVPPGLKHTIAEEIVTDAISASYPYGALSAAVLSRAAQVPYFKDSLVFIADDAALGEYRKKYKNLLVLMEEKQPVTFFKNEEAKKIKLISSEELFYKVANNNAKVDQQAVLQARLLDNFMMDFDRHEEQWEWLVVDDEKSKTYYPVPKDRDQVFFINMGAIPHIAKNKNILPELEGFHKKAEHIQTFNRPARNFDRYFLNELSAGQWSSQVDLFLLAMTDSVIETAMHMQPVEIQSYAAEKIIKTLKEKRRFFKADMMKYYRFLSNTVSIVGTNSSDSFSVLKNTDGKVLVTVMGADSTGKVGNTIIYSRLFDPAETEEIRMYGLEADDKFILSGDNKDIKLRLIGGPGNDTFSNTGDAKKILAYDVSFEQNSIVGTGIKNKIKDDPLNNIYTRLGYLYDKKSPSIAFEYASDGGLFLGVKFSSTPQGFRLSPYRSSQKIFVTRAINSSSYHIKYAGNFVQVLKHTSLLISGDLKLPTSRTAFYGIGNTSINDQFKPSKHKYYLAHYSLGNLSFSFRDSVKSWLTLKAGPLLQYYSVKREDNTDTYIDGVYPGLPLATAALKTQYYAGAELGLEVNTRNNKLFPTRGIFFNVVAQTLFGLNNYSNQHTEATANFSFYTDFLAKKHLVFASAFGAGHNFGDYQFYQGQTLGFKENLRGYRIQRFTGRSRAYNNTELRWYMGDVNLYLFKGPFGLLGFNDVARVWADKESSAKWHDGYGGGIWLAPFNKLLVTGSLTYSEEEKNLLLISFGFQF
ncbi:MAG: BamA/TamA family outer membrane protein [Ferruginibacter sp.]